MKKLGSLSVFVLIFFIFNSTGFASDDIELPSMQLLITGTAGYAKNNEIFDATKNLMKSDENLYLAAHPSGTSKVNEADSTDIELAAGIDIAFRYFFSNFGIGLEVGQHTTEAVKAELSFTDTYFNASTSVKLQLTVVTTVATLFYRINTGSQNSFLLLGGGVGYYMGEMTVDYHGDSLLEGKNVYMQSKVGYHLLFEYDYLFDSGFTIFGGIKGRYVQLDEFKDGDKILYSDGDGLISHNGNKKLKAGLTGVAAYIGLGFSF